MNWHAVIQDEFGRLKKPVDESVVEEFAQHAVAACEAARAEGATPDEADAAVRALIESWCRETDGPDRIQRQPLIESAPAGPSAVAGLSLDVRLAFRLLRRQPGFACVSIVMIALGIGATTAIFSVVNGVLLKPLPWSTANRLVRVSDTNDRLAANNEPGAMTNVVYHAWRDHPQTIDGVATWSTVFFLVPGDGGIERVPAAVVTASLFSLLGASPILGSTFTEADERLDNTMVISHGFWRERFGGATDVIGKAMSFGGRTRTIVGVMPRGFEFPTQEVRFWTPLAVPPAYREGSLGHSVRIYNGLARLKPGATPTQAASEAEARLNTVPPPDLIWEMAHLTRNPGRLRVTRSLDSLVRMPARAVDPACRRRMLPCRHRHRRQCSRAGDRRRANRHSIGARRRGRRIARQLFVETTPRRSAERWSAAGFRPLRPPSCPAPGFSTPAAHRH